MDTWQSFEESALVQTTARPYIVARWRFGQDVEDLLLFIAVGLAAQMVDGAIGKAYGVISTSVLLSVGVPPATASAAVHTAETFTTGAWASRTGGSATSTAT